MQPVGGLTGEEAVLASLFFFQLHHVVLVDAMWLDVNPCGVEGRRSTSGCRPDELLCLLVNYQLANGRNIASSKTENVRDKQQNKHAFCLDGAWNDVCLSARGLEHLACVMHHAGWNWAPPEI